MLGVEDVGVAFAEGTISSGGIYGDTIGGAAAGVVFSGGGITGAVGADVGLIGVIGLIGAVGGLGGGPLGPVPIGNEVVLAAVPRKTPAVGLLRGAGVVVLIGIICIKPTQTKALFVGLNSVYSIFNT